MENALTCSAGTSVFLRLMNALVVSQCVQDPSLLYQTDYAPNIPNNHFDFIIVGGGAAGSVLANRLSENPNHNVLLIEAGGYPTSDSEIPGLNKNLHMTNIDWQYSTEPSDYSSQSFKDGRCIWPRGKVLGGSTTLSINTYLRGTPEDYEWEIPGWNSSEALRYFKKSEDCQSEKHLSNGLHGDSGFLKTSTINLTSEPYHDLLKAAASQAGYAELDDEGLGFFEGLTTIYKGETYNAAKAYLSPIKNRPNLKVALNTFVTEILIENNKALGVKVQGETIKAKLEVIISAGAINSPQLLMLSGLGPKHHLGDLGIKVVKDLPVGLNLQDHPAFLGFWLKTNITNTQIANLQSFFEYCVHRSGPLSHLGFFNVFYYFNAVKAHNPNVQFWNYNLGLNDEVSVRELFAIFQIEESIIDQFVETNKDHGLIWLGLELLLPKSRGFIKLSSADPFDKPLIHAGYFTDADDVEILLEAVKEAKRLISQPIMKSHGIELLDLKVPACSHLEFDSDDYWGCHVRSTTCTGYDPSGTCKMGDDGVVDAKLRVHGIQSLRVVDASVFPRIPGANLGAPTMMLAEKAADLIKQDY